MKVLLVAISPFNSMLNFQLSSTFIEVEGVPGPVNGIRSRKELEDSQNQQKQLVFGGESLNECLEMVCLVWMKPWPLMNY